ncbi:helix-turn-helix transcriptional regulator [Nocardia sp. NPDC050697]|uniref:helix-turn-helix domain-containing protein n=1 Tax=Nocardia sp. NPDC050697 TaxID=3155158 RepID=UPI0033C0AD60
MRLARGLTQAELAARVRAEIERSTGKPSPVDAQAISRIECGEISWPRRSTREALVAVLGVESESALGLFAKRTRRESERGDTTKRRSFLALTSLAVSELGDSAPGRVGVADVMALRSRFARLVELDSYLGGADTFHLYFSELARNEQILAHSNLTSNVRRELTTILAAEQAQQSGWAAFDAGHSDLAVRFFDYGLKAAEEANSMDLVANSLLHMSYVSGTAESMRSAESACTAIGPEATGRRMALLDSRRAWSYAVGGNREQAVRALDAARHAVDSEDDAAPAWCSWVDHAELDIMTGRVWSVLGRPDAAIEPLTKALENYPDSWSRDKSLYLTWLADAHLDAGDIDRAIVAGEQALALATRAASVRPLARVREVANRCAATSSTFGVDLARRAQETRLVTASP